MTVDLSTIHLAPGAHRSRDAGMCAMEAVAYIAGEPHTDHPACVCPTIAAFMRSWNDGLPSDAERDRLLKPLLPRVIGTASTPEVAERRSHMALNWLTGEWLPAWLRLAGLDEHADRCAGGERAAAWAAAWAAAGDALAPTVAMLQESATALVIRMCEVS